MEKALWTPSLDRQANSRMQAFLEYVQHQLKISEVIDYPTLYNWSITQLTQFWPAIWDFFKVIAHQRWKQVLEHPDQMPGARWFPGARLNFAENLLRRRDDHLALVFNNERGERRTFSYALLYENVAQLAAAMIASGIRTGDTIAVFMPNIPETVIIMLACASIGAIFSACSPDFGVSGALDRFAQIEPQLLFAASGYYYNGNTYDSLGKIAQLQSALPSLKKTIIVPYLPMEHHSTGNGGDASYIPYYDFIFPQARTLEFKALPFDHPLYIVYSSGTTGSPKCIVHGAGGVLLQHLKELGLHTDISEKDRFFYFTTCGWMMWNWLVSGLALGATLYLYDGSALFPKPKVLFDLIEREKITVFGASAKYFTALEKARFSAVESYDLSALRTILSTGSPLLPGNFDYIYQKIKPDLCLSSISGGTDIVSCFALGNPLLPVYRGELQCRGLGLKVEIFDEAGQAIQGQKGELVCTAPFPVMPIYFWNDPDNHKYQSAYFNAFKNIWAHGDYAELTEHQGIIIYGRSDSTLNPGGIRIGTAEIYRQVETLENIVESLVIGQEWNDDVRIILFVKLAEGQTLTPELKDTLKLLIRSQASPHHVPAKIIQVPDIPKTVNGKIVELAVREIIHGRPVKNQAVLANPEALAYFKNLKELEN
ncbi:MAG: acetoacetate--CoA ligase [Gammaproteobacteria bacterium]